MVRPSARWLSTPEEPDAFTDSAIKQYTDLATIWPMELWCSVLEERQRAESEIRQLNASLEKRVAERTVELVESNNQLKRAQEELRQRSEQMQIHRDVLLEPPRSDNFIPSREGTPANLFSSGGYPSGPRVLGYRLAGR